MKQMKKITAILLALLLLASGCSKKGTDETETGAAEETQQTETVKPVELSLSSMKAVQPKEVQMYFPADMTYESTDYLYACSPVEGYYISVGALAAEKDIRAAYLWVKEDGKTYEFELPCDGVCKGVNGWTGLGYGAEAEGVYTVFDDTGAAVLWRLTKENGSWTMQGTKVTPPTGYYAAYAAEGARNCGNWFIVLRSTEGGGDRVLASYDFGKNLTEVDLGTQTAAHGNGTVVHISGRNSKDYTMQVRFADQTVLDLSGTVADQGKNLTEKEAAEQKEAFSMFEDAATVPQILG